MNQNRDLEKAKGFLDENRCSLAIAKDGDIVFSSKSSGILPLYQAYINSLDFEGACLADKVIGLGAAMIIVKLKLSEIFTYTISESAYLYLHSNNIMISYDNKVEYIKNRTNEGKCPVETMADESRNSDELLSKVEEFLKGLGLI